mmetsp:Transcript_21075/g.46326  ORF Transcript_21075/g.46326 Transcript_21075/m.46326 type:complete len:217 (-) Transcript_21075:1637-2287(-)
MVGLDPLAEIYGGYLVRRAIPAKSSHRRDHSRLRQILSRPRHPQVRVRHHHPRHRRPGPVAPQAPVGLRLAGPALKPAVPQQTLNSARVHRPDFDGKMAGLGAELGAGHCHLIRGVVVGRGPGPEEAAVAEAELVGAAGGEGDVGKPEDPAPAQPGVGCCQKRPHLPSTLQPTLLDAPRSRLLGQQEIIGHVGRQLLCRGPDRLRACGANPVGVHV